jgi:hypothetical protein
MKKGLIKALSCGTMALVACTLLVGCGAKPAYQADLTQEGVFGIYGTPAVSAENKSVTLSPVASGSYSTSSSTYFGETDKNYDWTQGGMTVKLQMNITVDDYTATDYSVWSLALNETDGAYITENTTFLVGTADGVKFAYAAIGVDGYEQVRAGQEGYTIEADGKYTIVYDYDVNQEGNITLTVKLLNAQGQAVYTSADNAVTAIDHAGYTPGDAVAQEDVKGLRYLWLTRTSVDVEVTDLSIWG